jgi:hypothetical protein
MRLPDVTADQPDDRFRDNPGYVAYCATQLDEASTERLQSIIHGILEAGDPEDEYDMVVVVSHAEIRVET